MISEEQLLMSRQLFVKNKIKNKPECRICMSSWTSSMLSCCNQPICKSCTRKLESLQCPFCRCTMNDLPKDVIAIIKNKVDKTKELALAKDTVTSIYLSAYPRVNVNLIYSALTYLENPWILLDMRPKEITNLLKNL